MFTTKISPRFGDIDGLRHVNNTVLAGWFELGRNPILRMFEPNLNLSYDTWTLILAHTDFDFVGEMFFQYDVEIRTYVKHIGNKSFTTYHAAWQEGRLCVQGSAVLINYDFNKKNTTEIPADIKEKLKEQMFTEEIQ
jgi:acyl-CoA thioester hydrolase